IANTIIESPMIKVFFDFLLNIITTIIAIRISPIVFVSIIYNGVSSYCTQRLRLGDVAVFENRQPVTAAE
ncbi:MAG: hypothetical protein J0H55_15810, partial [Chitinophagaceae bacterium]|nr:hypothetical protein [Chitinophagaceae bacterium]